jgi:hypothetical protein
MESVSIGGKRWHQKNAYKGVLQYPPDFQRPLVNSAQIPRGTGNLYSEFAFCYVVTALGEEYESFIVVRISPSFLRFGPLPACWFSALVNRPLQRAVRLSPSQPGTGGIAMSAEYHESLGDCLHSGG